MFNKKRVHKLNPGARRKTGRARVPARREGLCDPKVVFSSAATNVLGFGIKGSRGSAVADQGLWNKLLKKLWRTGCDPSPKMRVFMISISFPSSGCLPIRP